LTRYRYLIAGILFVLAIVFAADHYLWFTDDRDHPDGVLMAEQFAAARIDNSSSVNVIAVAGGNWLALCLAGPGTDPQDTLLQFGRKNRVRVGTIQRIRSWLHVGSVPDGEVALVFVTGRYSIRSRRLPNMTGNPQFKTACALRTDPGLTWR
jgi:hypothetical protein